MITSPCIGTMVISGLSSRARAAAAIGLGLARVLGAEEDRARQIGRLDDVEVDQIGRAHAHEGQVLHHLVAQRPAPTTRTFAAASRSCRHQEIRRSRL